MCGASRSSYQRRGSGIGYAMAPRSMADHGARAPYLPDINAKDLEAVVLPDGGGRRRYPGARRWMWPTAHGMSGRISTPWANPARADDQPRGVLANAGIDAGARAFCRREDGHRILEAPSTCGDDAITGTGVVRDHHRSVYIDGETRRFPLSATEAAASS